MSTATQTEIAAKNHRRAVHFFWCFLIGATMISLLGNIAHAIWRLIPFVVIQIGTAAVPPLFLLAVVHGIALSVRAGASGTVYRWAVTATAVIGVGAFVLSFRTLRDLLIQTGTPPAWAWIFPTIIDTAVAVSTLMLVALGDKPARRTRTISTQIAPVPRPVRGANTQVSAPARKQAVQQFVAKTPVPSAPERAQTSAPSVPSWVASAQGSAHTTAHADDVDLASLAADVIESGVTTQPVETVIAVLAAMRDGATINSAAKASGINYRTAQRIVQAAAQRRQRQLVAVG